MSLLWVKLICKKDIGVIKEGTVGYVFRDNPNESVVWAHLKHHELGAFQFRIARSLIREYFRCSR